jgi:hypothetical protein
MTQDQKLTSIEEKLKRWMTRGRRAQTAIDKLLRQRQRLLKTASASRTIEAKAEFVQALDDQLTNVIEGKPADMAKLEDLARPAFLDRTNPLIAEQMTAARKKAEAAERSKMPLTGRDAMKAIRAKKTG